MQVPITTEERQEIIDLTKAHGRTKWFCEGAGIAWEALDRLRQRGEGEEDNVAKARKFLRSKKAKQMLAA
jgi:hypothetical protein